MKGAQRVLTTLCLFLAAFLVAGAATGADFFVNTYTDIADTDLVVGLCDNGFGLCSLREAITEANDLAGADTIYLPPGTFSMSINGANEDLNLTGDMDITDDVTIIGIQSSRIESQVGRVMHILSGNVSMTGLTMAEGDAVGETGTADAGGAIYNAGAGVLTLNNCTMTTNQGKTGGAVYNDTGGTLTINASTLTNNSAQGSTVGGAVYNNGTMNIINSTVSDNHATGFGGGIYNNSGTLTLNNVTLANNQATGAGSGGGIAINGGTVNVSNTIMANNLASGPNDDCFGAFTSLGYNLVEDTDGCTGFTGTGDITGMDLPLGPLQNNGGTTFTHALPILSPAIDAGNPTLGVCEDFDQRGLARPQGAACDIGAFEYFPNCPVITLAPTVLPILLPGQYITQTITPTGGVGPYTFAVTAGTLPAGLYLNPLTGELSGIPLVAGDYSFTVTAFDANFCAGSQVYTFSCPLITMSPLLLPNATQGQSYSQDITATGGTGPYLYALSAGFLPPGVTLNSSTGQLSGSPTVSGAFFFVVMAVDSTTLCTGVQPYTLIVDCALTISPTSLPNARESTVYNTTGVQLTATGGTGGPYTFAIISGSLPASMTLDGTGLISGTPDAATAGVYTILVEATDALNCTGTILLTLTVDPCIVLTPDVLPTAVVNVAYDQILTATGGVGAVTFSHGAGLPTGIALSAGGVFSGTPTVPGVYTFTVTATDGSCNVNKDYTIIVSPAGCPSITLSPLTLPIGTVNSAYSETLLGNGGTGPYTFVRVAGILPPGLALDTNTGAITGMPTSPGVFVFTVAAVDSNFCTGNQEYTILVSESGCATITLNPTTLPDGSTGTPYLETVVASGGSGSYTYFLAGLLPDGLTLNPTTGEISGTPTVPGTFDFSVGAVDSNLCFGSRAYTIIVSGSGGSCSVFSDDFNDNTVNWTVEKPNWTESGGNLIGAPQTTKAGINSGSLFPACSGVCTFSADMMTAGGVFNKVWMFAWYGDKRNRIEVLMSEGADKFVVKQRVGGVVVAKGKGLMPLAPGVSYNVEITFTGTQFILSVNGNPISTFNAAGGLPNGIIGFQVKNTTGTFGSACVD